MSWWRSCLVAPFGALADKIGRRSVYAFGFLWLAAGFLLYPARAHVAAAHGLRAVLLGGRRGHRHHVRDGAGGYRRRSIARAAGRARGIFPGPGRGRAGPAARPDAETPGRRGRRRAHRRAHHVVARGRALRRVGGGGVRRTEARHSERTGAGHAAATASWRTALRRRDAIRASGSPICCSSAPSAIAWCSAHFSRCACSRPGSSGTSAWPMPSTRARLPFVAAMVAGLATALIVGAMLDRVDRLRIGVAAMALGGRGLPALRLRRRSDRQVCSWRASPCC